MNKKTLIFYISLAVILLAGILVGSFSLFNGSDTKGHKVVKVMDKYPVVAAVPSDAMALAVFESAETGVERLLDSTSFWGAFVYETKKSPVFKYLTGIEPLVGRLPMAVSLHNCGSTVPIVILDAGKNSNDSTRFVLSVLEAAEDAGLTAIYHRFGDRSYIISSSSEVLVASSRTHIDDGMSILENESFCSCASMTSGSVVAFFANSYASKLLPAYFTKKVSAQADKVKHYASWTAFYETDHSERKVALNMANSLGQNSYVKSFDGLAPSDCKFAEAAPSVTAFAMSIPFASVEDYVEIYDRHLDATTKMSAVRAQRKKLADASGVKPIDWAKALDVKEVAKVQWYRGEELLEACMLRVGQRGCSYIFKGLDGVDEKNYTPEAHHYEFSGFANALFGDDYAVASDSFFAYRDGWLISGQEEAIKDYLSRGGSLKATLSQSSPDIIPSKPAGFVMFFAGSSCRPDDIFGKAFKNALSDVLTGASRADVVLANTTSGATLRMERPLVDTPLEDAEIVVTGTGIDVPKGPFKVKNCATNKINSLSQQSNNYLTLSDENGKAVWSVEFHEPLCGRVEEVDHYANGKIQFLFAAGSKLWLLDRLGRFVSGFPVALPKAVLLGPALYELPEGRTVGFLYTDGSIGFTSMKGEARSFWKGVEVPGQVVALPELLKAENGKFWVIRTLKEARIYPYEGGEPVYAKSGKEAIRSDSAVTPNGKGGFTVTCNDGKTRTVKL